MNIQFESIRINQVSGNAGVFVGSNIQLNWSSQTKVNSALGTVIGDRNLLSNNLNVVYDNDLIDMPSSIGADANTSEGDRESR